MVYLKYTSKHSLKSVICCLISNLKTGRFRFHSDSGLFSLGFNSIFSQFSFRVANPPAILLSRGLSSQTFCDSIFPPQTNPFNVLPSPQCKHCILQNPSPPTLKKNPPLPHAAPSCGAQRSPSTAIPSEAAQPRSRRVPEGAPTPKLCLIEDHQPLQPPPRAETRSSGVERSPTWPRDRGPPPLPL